MSASSLGRGFFVILALFIVALTLSCSSSNTKTAKTVRLLSAAEQKQLEKYARQGDILAEVALDRSIAHMTLSFPGFFNTQRDYWFDPKTNSVVIDELGHRGGSIIFISHKKNSLVLKECPGGKYNPDRIIQTEISNATLELAKRHYSPEKFMDLFREGAEASGKLPSYAYAISNSEFLSYFYDPTHIGGVASDYSYGPKKSVKLNGREAYKVRISPSKSYNKKLSRGLEEDYTGRSYIDVYFDKKTDLPLKVDRAIDNSRLKYSTTANLDLVKVTALPTIATATNRKFSKRYFRRLLLPSEFKRCDFPTLGNSYKGFVCQPVTLVSTDSASWAASLSYQKDSDGFIVDEAEPGQSRSAKEQFINRIKGVSEEKTLMARSDSGLTGTDVHKDPIPEPKVRKVKVAGANATLYSYVGLVALEVKIGDKAVFIHDLDEYNDDFLLTEDMLLQIASKLLKKS